MKPLLAILAAIAIFFSLPAFAVDDEHHHAESIEKLGTVFFPVSCASTVQKPMERGVALLHSFAYDEARQQFQEIAQQDPNCAIAYWGQAMSLYHQLWTWPSDADFKQGLELMQKAQAIKAKTQREREYIGALAVFFAPGATRDERPAAYAKGMKKVYEHYPQDHEAAIFYALSLLASADGKELDNSRQAISILNKLFQAQPDHPGVAHYLIHACDNPKFAQEGLAAARAYAAIAPSSPHAVHMPSHIFTRLGLWQDDIQSNLAAIDVAHRQSPNFHHMMHHRLHSMDFLQYAYLQIGDDAKAKALVEEVESIKREDVEPEFREFYFTAMLAEFPAHYTLERRQWKEALALQPPADIPPVNQAITYWAQAIAAGHLHDADAAGKAVEHFDALAEAAKKDNRHYGDGMKTDRDEAHAWLAFAEGKNEEALKLLGAVADQQDEIGKAEVALPAREMLADMLLDMGRVKEALAEYEKDLHTDPNRFNGLYGAAKAAELAREPQKASTYYAQLLKNCDNGLHSDRPELARAKEQLVSGNYMDAHK